MTERDRTDLEEIRAINDRLRRRLMNDRWWHDWARFAAGGVGTLILIVLIDRFL